MDSVMCNPGITAKQLERKDISTSGVRTTGQWAYPTSKHTNQLKMDHRPKYEG